MIYVVCLLACNRSQCLKHNRYIRRMDRDALAAALARFSAASVYHVRQLDKGEAAWHKQPSGAFKRAAKAALGPFHGCFKPLSVPSKEDASVPVVFYAADMKQVLRLLMEKCPSVAALIRRHAGTPLRAILAHDECTAGNVLNPLQRPKTLLFYCAFTLLDPILESSRGWYPVAAVTHDQIQAATGGISAITAAFIRHWVQSDLATPFQVDANLRISIELEMFISDLESQRASLAAKGSAGLRPCIFCSNCVMKNAYAAERDPNFLTVLEHNFDLFRKYDRGDLENLMIHWLSCAPRMKKMKKSFEKNAWASTLTQQAFGLAQLLERTSTSICFATIQCIATFQMEYAMPKFACFCRKFRNTWMSPQTACLDKCNRKAGAAEAMKMPTGAENCGELLSLERSTKEALLRRSLCFCCYSGLPFNGSTRRRCKSIANAFCSWDAALQCCGERGTADTIGINWILCKENINACSQLCIRPTQDLNIITDYICLPCTSATGAPWPVGA